jgi:hypothetical protein
MSESPPAEGFHSPDGLWWWNGQAWRQALSWDGRYWFNGREWVDRPLPPKLGLTRRLRIEGIVWLVLLGAWCPLVAGLAEHHASTPDVAWVGGVVGGVGVLTTLIFGARLGYRGLWRAAGVACLAGAVVLLFWFNAITLAAPDPTNQNDHSAGAGTVILAVPVVLVVGIMLGLGAAVGRVGRWVRGRTPAA